MDDIKVKASNRTHNLNYIATLELKRLGIDEPTPEQISNMKSLLEYSGTITTKLSLKEELNEQETACLMWVIRGKKAPQIAQLMKTKHSNVRNYLVKIKQKLNCTTMPQAVYEGIRYS